VGVTDSTVCVAWVAWNPGAVNSEEQSDNGFPADNSTVEGRIEVTSSALGHLRFDPPAVLDPGPASYPCWAVGPAHGAERPPLVWTSIDLAADSARRVSVKLAGASADTEGGGRRPDKAKAPPGLPDGASRY
jgi:hypothetical protein